MASKAICCWKVKLNNQSLIIAPALEIYRFKIRKNDVDMKKTLKAILNLDWKVSSQFSLESYNPQYNLAWAFGRDEGTSLEPLLDVVDAPQEVQVICNSADQTIFHDVPATIHPNQDIEAHSNCDLNGGIAVDGRTDKLIGLVMSGISTKTKIGTSSATFDGTENASINSLSADNRLLYQLVSSDVQKVQKQISSLRENIVTVSDVETLLDLNSRSWQGVYLSCRQMVKLISGDAKSLNEYN